MFVAVHEANVWIRCSFYIVWDQRAVGVVLKFRIFLYVFMRILLMISIQFTCLAAPFGDTVVLYFFLHGNACGICLSRHKHNQAITMLRPLLRHARMAKAWQARNFGGVRQNRSSPIYRQI